MRVAKRHNAFYPFPMTDPLYARIEADSGSDSAERKKKERDDGYNVTEALEALSMIELGSEPESPLASFVLGKHYIIEGCVPEWDTGTMVDFWFTGVCEHAGLMTASFKPILASWNVRLHDATWRARNSPFVTITTRDVSIEVRCACDGNDVDPRNMNKRGDDRLLRCGNRFAFAETRVDRSSERDGLRFQSIGRPEVRVFICEVNGPNEANGKPSCSEGCAVL